MATFKNRKALLLSSLLKADWREEIYHALDTPDKAREAVNPLLAMLPRPEAQWQAAVCLGRAVALLALDDKEAARNIMRRLMWSLNEESGNLGWGIPQAMGCIVGESPAMAREFGRILVSYIIDTGKDDNFLDHAPLRVGAYWGIGQACAMTEYAAFGKSALPRLVKGLEDEDAGCRAMAAWAMGKATEALFREGQQMPPDDGVLLRQAAGLLSSADAEADQTEIALLEHGRVMNLSGTTARTTALLHLRAAIEKTGQ